MKDPQYAIIERSVDQLGANLENITNRIIEAQQGGLDPITLAFAIEGQRNALASTLYAANKYEQMGYGDLASDLRKFVKVCQLCVGDAGSLN